MAMSAPARAAVECFIVRLLCISNSIRPSHIIVGCGPGPLSRCATAHDSTIADGRPARESVDVVGIIPNTLVAAATRRQGFGQTPRGDRKSTRLNSSHVATSYAVCCLKKKK